jgi:hypothetical protein
MLYHTEYDKETILSNHDLEDYKLGFTIEDSESAIEKLKNILKNRNENL